MKVANLPINEEERLRALRSLEILDTLEEQAYDDLTLLAAQICGTPIALISLVDEHRQWFKSHYGLDARETPRDLAFCAHAILQDNVFVVENSAKDERFRDNPLVVGAPNVVFYAGAPLMLDQDIKIGTLCVINHSPQNMTDPQKAALQALARQVVSQLRLRLAVKELQKLDQAKENFFSMASHEMRTPLTSIGGALSLISKQFGANLSAPTQGLLDVATKNCDRLIYLINDLLDMSKMQAGRFELSLRQVPANGIAREAVQLNQPYCDRTGCRIELVCVESDAMQVRADPARMAQVLTNLISNAAKYSNSGEPIKIKVERQNNRAWFHVTNRGPGIMGEDLNKLFIPFSQTSTTSQTTGPSTGLGLSICKQSIELHGGQISVKSEPNEETTFSFWLPI